MISSNIKLLGKYTMYIDQVLGGGCFGEIFLGCETLNTAQKVAIKRVKTKSLSTLEFETYIENEKNILSMISHPNLIRFYDSMQLEDCFYMIMEYCPESISSFASKFPMKCIPEIQALIFIKDVAMTMLYLNSKKIIHRNLYPNNLLFQDGIVKICSFSFAKIAENIDKMPELATSVGIPLYEAPEIYYKKPYSFKCDVWSLGLILYQMLYGRLPWIGKGLNDLFTKISNQELVFPETPEIQGSVKNLIREMLVVDEKKRCDWGKILEFSLMKED